MLITLALFWIASTGVPAAMRPITGTATGRVLSSSADGGRTRACTSLLVEIARTRPPTLPASVSSHVDPRAHNGSSIGFQHPFNSYWCCRHEITIHILDSNSKDAFWGDFYLDSARSCSVGNFEGG
jgi:hypothetical protein